MFLDISGQLPGVTVTHKSVNSISWELIERIQWGYNAIRIVLDTTYIIRVQCSFYLLV